MQIACVWEVAMHGDEARRLLRDAGMRATGARVAVTRLLADAERPLAHSEVVERLDGWDQATLYRNLRALVAGGLARVVSEAGGLARYALLGDDGEATHAHPHFVCRDCGAHACLPPVSIDPPSGWDRALREAAWQVVGRCPDCHGGQRLPSR